MEESVACGDSWHYSGKLSVLILSLPVWILSIPSLGVFLQFWYSICLVVLFWCRKAPFVVLLCFSLCGENWRCHLAPVRFYFIVLWRTGGATWHRFVFFLLWLLWWCRKVPGFCSVLAIVLSILFLIFIFIFVAVFYFCVVMCHFSYFSFYFSLWSNFVGIFTANPHETTLVLLG